jgi:superfamily I DNA and/or RNA helicase
MHPDISAFPRERFYTDAVQEDDVDEGGDEELDDEFVAVFDESSDGLADTVEESTQLLQDARSMRVDRKWKFSRYARRALWIGVSPGKKGTRSNSNQNQAEAEVVLDELEHFVSWAQENLRRDEQGKEKPWEVAVLTYYRGQESLLRNRLQQLSGQHGNTRNFHLPRGGHHAVHVTLCTVDRFQGHEADIVFLSFVKSGTVGFLNSPNRLNVALTRARYQLVLVGHQAYFSSKLCPSDLLRSVATSPYYKGDIKWGAQP